MTLSKLSLRNARRQARDYLVYFVTVVLAAALLYAFNGLVFSTEIRALSQSMATLPLVIVLASAVVVCVFGWLVSYSTRFMLSRRSRELGTYLLIGLESRQVARLFFLENLAVGGCALVLGILLGGMLYQAFRAIVLTLFGMAYRFSFGFSLPATGLTALYFLLIYLYALRKSRKYIRKANIHDLLYLDRRNEEKAVRTGRKRRLIFIASILLGVLGTALLMAGNLSLGLAGAGCIILFLYGFFLSFASGVPAFFDRNPARKYRGQNLLVFRSLTAKLATMGILMATVSLIFTATLISEGTGLVFQGLYQGRSAPNACFDLFIGIDDEQQSFEPYLEYVEDNIPVEDSLLYSVYCGVDTDIIDYLDLNVKFYHYGIEQDMVMKYSDYAALRAIAGYPEARPEPGQYLIHCINYLEKALRQYDRTLTMGGVALTPGGIRTEHFLQQYSTGNGNRYLLVVPDEAVINQPVHHQAYAAKTVNPVSEEQYQALRAINQSESRTNPMGWDAIHTRANEKAEVAAQTALTVFPLYYLALALTMTAATILTIQQLAESERYRRQFALLRKLGMDRREMAGALRRQFAIYYAMPAIPPVLMGVPFLLNLAKLPEPGVMVGVHSPAAIAGIALGIFFLVYAVYILLAYTSLKRNVLPDGI